jgi:formylglycine-generating enzyme required for sulfatase activity
MRTFLTPGLATALVLLLLAGCSPDPEVPVPLRERTNPRDGSVLIEIPAGEFVMGSDEYRNSKPRFNLNLPTYWIGKHEITNRQFAAFVRATGYQAEGNWRQLFKPGLENHPVASVSWYDARAYCRWAGLRLPTEAEWEKAARGLDGRLFPWGDTWDAQKCNNRDMKRPELMARMASVHNGRGTLPVGSFPEGASPFGLLDAAGNVFEWTTSPFDPYPYRAEDGREANDDPVEVSLRGGGWAYRHVGFFRTDTRSRCKPPIFTFFVGFRVADSGP